MDAMTETIRIRIEPDKKAALTKMYEGRGTTLSAAIRGFLTSELESCSSPLDRFNAIMKSADEKIEAYGAPEPTIDDIVDFVAKSRCERAEGTVAA